MYSDYPGHSGYQLWEQPPTIYMESREIGDINWIKMAQARQSAPDAPASTSLQGDDLYLALADKRRRYTLHYLKQREEPVSVRELSEQVAAWENDKPVDELGHQERKRVYVALHQSHLGTLSKEGLIQYDEDTQMVSASEAFDGVDVYLEVVPKASVPWNRFYLGLVLASTCVLGLAWVGVPPFDTIPDIGVAVLVLVAFAFSAFIQTITSRRMRFGDAGPPPEVSSE